MQFALKGRHFSYLQPDGGTRRELDWLRKITKRPLAIWRTQSRNVQDRLALEFAPAALIEKRIHKRNAIRRCGDGSENATRNLVAEHPQPAREQDTFRKFRVEPKTVFEHCSGSRADSAGSGRCGSEIDLFVECLC